MFPAPGRRFPEPGLRFEKEDEPKPRRASCRWGASARTWQQVSGQRTPSTTRHRGATPRPRAAHARLQLALAWYTGSCPQECPSGLRDLRFSQTPSYSGAGCVWGSQPLGPVPQRAREPSLGVLPAPPPAFYSLSTLVWGQQRPRLHPSQLKAHQNILEKSPEV